jgi:hypothetical protein
VFRIGTDAESCKCGNKPPVSVKCGEFIELAEKLSASQKNSVSWRQSVRYLVKE